MAALLGGGGPTTNSEFVNSACGNGLTLGIGLDSGKCNSEREQLCQAASEGDALDALMLVSFLDSVQCAGSQARVT